LALIIQPSLEKFSAEQVQALVKDLEANDWYCKVQGEVRRY